MIRLRFVSTQTHRGEIKAHDFNSHTRGKSQTRSENIAALAKAERKQPTLRSVVTLYVPNAPTAHIIYIYKMYIWKKTCTRD